MNFLNLGPMELAVIGVIALVVVGPRKLPELGRMVGRWMKMVREASEEMKRGLYMEEDYRPPKPRKPTPAIDRSPAREDEPAEIVDAGSRSERERIKEREESSGAASEEKGEAENSGEKTSESSPPEDAPLREEDKDYD